MSKDTVKIGIIGMGNMGTGHAGHILEGKVPRMELVAVCDINPERLKPYPKLKHFESSEKLIRSGLVDAVLIATPHYAHTTIGIDALSHNLHTIVEKPISVTKYDAQKLLDAYKKAKKKNPKLQFCAMFNQRTDPYYIKIHELIQNGVLGRIQRSNWIITNWFRPECYYRSGGWRATWAGEGGGVLVNQCPHNIDLYQWLCGMPSAVYAIGGLGKYHDIETEDECCALFEYPDGATGSFITTTGEAPGTNRLEIVGDKGKLVFESFKGVNSLQFYLNTVPTSEYSKTTKKNFGTAECWEVKIPLPDNRGEQHIGIKKNFVAAILDGAELIAPAEEGIKAVELANAMQYSLITHQRVELPMKAFEYQKFLGKLIKDSKFVKKVDKNAGPTDLAGSVK